MLVFIAIPALIFSFIEIYFVLSNEGVKNFVLSYSQQKIEGAYFSFLLANPVFFIISTILGAGYALFFLFVQGGLINLSLRSSRFSFRELLTSSRRSFFKYLGFSLVSFIFLIGLFLLLIIPGIIFSVYWLLGSFVFFNEKKNIRESLKKSRELISGRWWITLWYVFLFGLIFLGFSVATQVIRAPLSIYELIDSSGGVKSPLLFVIGALTDTTLQFFVNLLSLPLGVLFGKNLYFEFSKVGRKK